MPPCFLPEGHGLWHVFPVAGRLVRFAPFWDQITSVAWVRDIIQRSYMLELANITPVSGLVPTRPPPRFLGEMAEEVKD